MSGTVCVISSDLTYIRLLLQALQGTISKATFLFCWQLLNIGSTEPNDRGKSKKGYIPL